LDSIAPAAEFAASTRNPRAAAPATRAARYVAADAYRTEHGFPCLRCTRRFPAAQLSTVKAGPRRRSLCIDCQAATRREQRAARLTNLAIPCNDCHRTLPMIREQAQNVAATFVQARDGSIVCAPCEANRNA
jgi:hypothetical protein